MELEHMDFTGWVRDTDTSSQLYHRGQHVATLSATASPGSLFVTMHPFKFLTQQTTVAAIIEEIRQELRTWYGEMQLLLSANPIPPGDADSVQVLYKLAAAGDLPEPIQCELDRVLGPKLLVFHGSRADWQGVWQAWISRGLDVNVVLETQTGISTRGGA